MSRERVAVRAYGVLTRLYPRRFRDEYGIDMVSMFRDQSRDESAWRVVCRSAIDLAITIPTQHLEASMRRNPSPLVPITYLAIALAGVLLAVIGGTNATTAIIGLAIALGAGTIGVISWRRATPVRETTLTGHWWKFLLAGACLIGLVILGAEVGIEAWELMIAGGLASIVLAAIGLMLGLSHLLTHRTRRIPT